MNENLKFYCRVMKSSNYGVEKILLLLKEELGTMDVDS